MLLLAATWQQWLLITMTLIRFQTKQALQVLPGQRLAGMAHHLSGSPAAHCSNKCSQSVIDSLFEAQIRGTKTVKLVRDVWMCKYFISCAKRWGAVPNYAAKHLRGNRGFINQTILRATPWVFWRLSAFFYVIYSIHIKLTLNKKA